MTEVEWLAATDPRPLIRFLEGKASDRKLRLFAAACCRRNWHILDPDISQPGVELIERYADNLASVSELEELHRSSRQKGDGFEKRRGLLLNRNQVSSLEDHLNYLESQKAYLLAYASKQDDYIDMVLIYTTQCKVRNLLGRNLHGGKEAHEEFLRLSVADLADLTHLLRDICGHLFRPVTFDPSWTTSTVGQLAESIYQGRTFVGLPILADALEESGCHNGAILNHLRSNGPHVRGCWALDLILGKE
jgi:hypothetical protein